MSQFRPLKGTARANTTCPVTRVHTDPTNAARVRPEQTDAKTLTRSQNEYESITFEQSCEQVPNEAAVEAELEEHASLQHGHGHACRKPPRWPPRRPQHRPARPGGGPSVGTGPPEVRGEPRGPLKLTWCTSLPTRCASSSSSPAGAPRQKHYMERGSRVPLISALLRWTRERPD